MQKQPTDQSSGSQAVGLILLILIGLTVPVEAAYQIWRVTKVLSMGKVHTHILEDTQKRFKIKPWEIFEKIHF